MNVYSNSPTSVATASSPGTALSSDSERLLSGRSFLRYQNGDFFVRHQDGNTHQLDFDHLRIRRISIVVFLNDHSTSQSQTALAAVR
jgi:predicted 2-oxoglutarate/Fe(II)-dependent dioxygenase YbiX